MSFSSGRRFAIAKTVALGAAFAVAAIPHAAPSQAAYPSKPIRILVGAAPGGSTDVVARILAEALTPLLKQQVIVDNRTGANGIIASQQLARSAADGYTLGVVQTAHTVNPAVVRGVPYNTLADFTPIASLARCPLVFVASTKSGVKNVKEYVALARSDPAAATFASFEGSSLLAIEQIANATQTKPVVAQYKGAGPALTDLSGGTVNFMVTTAASTLQFRNGGKLSFPAVLATERSALLPDVPTLAEQGFPVVEAVAWYGVLAPAGLPVGLRDQIAAAVSRAMTSSSVQKRLETLSLAPWTLDPEHFSVFIRNELESSRRLAKQAGIEPE